MVHPVMGIRFSKDVALGSVLTIIVVLLASIQGWILFNYLSNKVALSTLMQMENSQAIDKLRDSLAEYRSRFGQQSVDLSKKVEELRGDVEALKRELYGRR